MIFLSYWFIGFVIILLPLYWLARWPRPRLAVLMIGSIIFHAHFAGPAGVLPIVALAAMTYLIGLSRRPQLCVLGMVVCGLALVFYKYTIFMSGQVVGAFFPEVGSALLATVQTALPSTPPLAISFFVFEFAHYLFEVHRGGYPIRNPVHFGLFSIFWPSLVAGPIKRYTEFIPALTRGTMTCSTIDVAAGFPRVAIGATKKVIADNLTLWIEVQTHFYEQVDVQWRWFFFVVLALRIYLDFSGYSDLAIGYARMLGIRLPENFNNPYIATSLTSFWRRWHISLSSWIRDYIYIPLGGGRRGPVRKVVGVLIAFALCGLWHGAGWNFLVWGLYHGIGLGFSANYQRLLGRPGNTIAWSLAQVPLLSGMLTFLFVGVGWYFFFYPLPTSLRMLRLLVGNV